MSTHTTCLAMERSHGTPAQKLALIYIAEYTDYDGHLALSTLPEVAREALLTEDELQAVMSALEAEGLFTRGHTDIDGDDALYFPQFNESARERPVRRPKAAVGEG